MSILRKKPFIESVIEALDEEQIATLQSVLNASPDGNKLLSLVDNSNLLRTYLTDKDDAIEGISLELEKGKALRDGFLIYDGTNTSFIATFTYQDLDLYSINPTNNSYTKIKEQCTIEELRRVVNGVASSAGANARAVIDPEDDDIVIYNEGMEVNNNGDVTVGRDLYVEDELVIDSAEKIVDPDGNPIEFGGGAYYRHYLEGVGPESNKKVHLIIINKVATPIRSQTLLAQNKNNLVGWTQYMYGNTKYIPIQVKILPSGLLWAEAVKTINATTGEISTTIQNDWGTSTSIYSDTVTEL